MTAPAYGSLHCTACHQAVGPYDLGGCPRTGDEHLAYVQLGQGYPNDAMGGRCTCSKDPNPEMTALKRDLRNAGRAWRGAKATERHAASAAKAVIVRADAAGIARTQIADLLGVDRQTVYRALGLKA